MGVVEMTIDSVRRSSLGDEWSIILKEKGRERYLPIYVSSPHASLVGRELQGIGYSELEDYVLSLTGVNIANSKVESVTISRFENNIFYATLSYSQHDRPYDVDCPPPIALALAVRVEAPIFTEEKVLSKAGIEVSARDRAI